MTSLLKQIFLIIIFLIPISVSAQTFHEFFSDFSKTQDSSKLYVEIDNANFLKNNEYFNPFVEGYTLIGYWLKPQITYNATKKFSLSAGFHAQKYSGVKGFSEFMPLFSLEFKTGERSKLIFGNLTNTINHNLSDYILADENYLTNNVESGLQFIHKSKRYFSDTWIDWRQFIFNGSPFPEILLFGTSNEISLIYNNNKSILDLNLDGVASHVGGQINSSNDYVQTIMNSATGLNYNIYPEVFFTKISLFSHYYTSLDQSPTKRLKYIYGYGVLSGVEVSNEYVDLRMAHWYGDYYFTKFGNQMFSSFNIEKPNYTEDQRAYINAHLIGKYEKIKNIKIGLGVNLYYDLYNLRMDYSMGFYIKSNLKFKLID
ncbi:MAG: hypothetical protein M0P32_06210 [Bacteroidales bacterium]|nr:hypothetical protein [Bacteroidales bacterium]